MSKAKYYISDKLLYVIAAVVGILSGLLDLGLSYFQGILLHVLAIPMIIITILFGIRYGLFGAVISLLVILLFNYSMQNIVMFLLVDIIAIITAHIFVKDLQIREIFQNKNVPTSNCQINYNRGLLFLQLAYAISFLLLLIVQAFTANYSLNVGNYMTYGDYSYAMLVMFAFLIVPLLTMLFVYKIAKIKQLSIRKEMNIYSYSVSKAFSISAAIFLLLALLLLQLDNITFAKHMAYAYFMLAIAPFTYKGAYFLATIVSKYLNHKLATTIIATFLMPISGTFGLILRWTKAYQHKNYRV